MAAYGVPMATVLLVRHGRTAANAGGILAGWSSGVLLDETGVKQAASVSTRLSALPLTAIVTSPLERTRQTAEAIANSQANRLTVSDDDRVGECRYGDWTGRPLKELSKDPLWKTVQAHPSAVTFPDGESMVAMQARALDAVRSWNQDLGDDALYVIVSHGDVIKAIVADALGVHLDQFQRIVIDPCSVSVIRYTPTRPFVLHVNDTGGDLAGLAPAKRKKRRGSSDAIVGGGDGTR